MKNNKTPEIRFAGFTGDWEETLAKDVFISISDKNHEDLPVLSASQEKGMVFRDDIGIDITYDKNTTQNYKRVIPNQFVMHLRSFQGGFAYSSIEGITSPAYTILDFANKDSQFPLFWKNIFTSKKFIKRLETITYGIRDGRSISFKDFITLKFRIPTLSEQTRIGEFFKTLDDTIALHEQELEQLKQTKQGFLQKMFPAEGETTPALRFAGFTGDWEEKKLGEVVDIVGGGTPNTNINEYWNGDIDWYSPTEIGNTIYVSESQKKITTLGLQKSSAKILPANKTILFTSRAGIGDMAILLKDGATNQGFQSFLVKENVNLYFIYSMGYKIKLFALKYATGSTFLEISGKSLADMSIQIPTPQEQTKIGNFFQSLDNLITLKQKELEGVKKTKQAFLQKMFI